MGLRVSSWILFALVASCVGAVACIGGSSDDGAPPTVTPSPTRTRAPTITPVPTPTVTPVPVLRDPQAVFSRALLTASDLSSEWIESTGPDSEVLQRHGPEMCNTVGAESWSELRGFVGGPDPGGLIVIHRVYEYRPDNIRKVIANIRQCANVGTLQPLPIERLGDEAVSAQISSGDANGTTYHASAIIRRNEYVTLIILNQDAVPVEASQLEGLARAADRKLAAAIELAPIR